MQEIYCHLQESLFFSLQPQELRKIKAPWIDMLLLTYQPQLLDYLQSLLIYLYYLIKKLYKYLQVYYRLFNKSENHSLL